MQRLYIFLLLSSKILSNRGQNDLVDEKVAQINPVAATWSFVHGIPLLRGSNIVSNEGSLLAVGSISRRIEVNLEKDVPDDDDTIDGHDFQDGGIDVDEDEEYTLDNEPQREFKQYDYIPKDNQKKLGGKDVNVKNSIGDDILRINLNATNDDNDDDKEEEKNMKGNETDGNTGSETTGTGNDDLQENTAIAILRHEDPPPERDVLGDSIFPLQQVSDNVFNSRRHDGR
jgi:hypothetical protein